ncbi:hypothetical protein CKAH01_10934 [Colletotrichum kahawae]|uniref:Uncharacterized protein n=1 Tax=Colletotrichum kahawae TaxID=34407 RepID=A0AAE0CWM5_COLKA|nr:hypothetical protein CKAH01_10934 [Colletotrichum kahawae]
MGSFRSCRRVICRIGGFQPGVTPTASFLESQLSESIVRYLLDTSLRCSPVELMRIITSFDIGIFQQRHAMVIYIHSRLPLLGEIVVAIGAVHRDMSGHIAKHSYWSLQDIDEKVFADLVSWKGVHGSAISKLVRLLDETVVDGEKA